jgi:hypothetical protein
MFEPKILAMHAEVRDLGVEISVKQYVAGLRVPVNDAHPGVLVQVQEPLRDPFYNVSSFPPVQQRSSF